MSRPDAYRAFPNAFRKRLLARETLIGCWCSLANPITTEVLGRRRLRLAAARRRAFAQRRHDLHPAADGAQGQRQRAGRAAVVERRRSRSSGCSTPASTTSSCRSSRPPTTRAAPSRRRAIRRRASAASRSRSAATASAPSPTTSATSTSRSACWCRSRAGPGLAAAAEIAAVDGVDGIFVGPSDLAAGFGHLGNSDHPERAGGDRRRCSTSPGRPASRSASSRRSRPTRAATWRWGRPSSPSAATWASSGVRRSHSAIAFRKAREPAEHLVELVGLVEHGAGAEFEALDADVRAWRDC